MGHVYPWPALPPVFKEHKVCSFDSFFFFFFDLGFTALSRIFHLYRADRSSKVGENRSTRRKTTWPSISRTWLSNIWPELGSNHSGEKPNGLRVNSLIHQATGARQLWLWRWQLYALCYNIEKLQSHIIWSPWPQRSGTGAGIELNKLEPYNYHHILVKSISLYNISKNDICMKSLWPWLKSHAPAWGWCREKL